ncbi:unnamed protein product [Mucor hiemalis]
MDDTFAQEEPKLNNMSPILLQQQLQLLKHLLTEDAYKHFAEYTKSELKMTVDDCKLLETMNIATKEKYVQMSQMSQRLMKEMSKLQNTYADFSTFIQQIDDIHQQSIEMEKVAQSLDEYSKHLEQKLLKAHPPTK